MKYGYGGKKGGTISSTPASVRTAKGGPTANGSGRKGGTASVKSDKG